MGAYDAMRKLESLRKKILVFEYLPLALLLAGFFVPMITGTYELRFIGIGGGLITAVVLGVQAPFLRKEYRDLYKNTFVKSMLSTMLDDVEYDWHMGFIETEVMGFGIVKIGNRFHSEDYISATYKGVKFRQADVVIEHETGSGKNRKIQTYFRGRMFEFNFSSKIVANVKVFSKSYTSHLNLKDFETEMEDVNFNKNFKVYASNAHDAFYILTPQMMERLAAINRRYPTIAFRFAPGKLYVGIVTGDSFDTSVVRKLSYPEEQARMKQDVQVIIDIIEMIDLIKDNDS